MSLIKFIDWLQQQDESTAETRKKGAILRGALPKCTDAEMLGSHSTMPWFKQYKKGTAYKGKKPKPTGKKGPK